MYSSNKVYVNKQVLGWYMCQRTLTITTMPKLQDRTRNDRFEIPEASHSAEEIGLRSLSQ